MERQFRINWPAIVEEAKQRRKKQKLTQARLANLACVSAPTISHFENGEKNIQLSTVLNILGVLGMTDQRRLDFLLVEQIYDGLRDILLFKGRDGDKIIQCGISREALEDYFDAENVGFMQAFTAGHEKIQHIARKKYLAGQIEPDGMVLIRTMDI
jgi:transcriptional regulator with XRE-family HTH domain